MMGRMESCEHHTGPGPAGTRTEAFRGGGRIELICGCMFSGKSLHLVERVRQARHARLKVAAFKHSSDDRYGQTHIVTHNGQRTEAMPVATAEPIGVLSSSEKMDTVRPATTPST